MLEIPIVPDGMPRQGCSCNPRVHHFSQDRYETAIGDLKVVSRPRPFDAV